MYINKLPVCTMISFIILFLLTFLFANGGMLHTKCFLGKFTIYRCLIKLNIPNLLIYIAVLQVIYRVSYKDF